MPLLYETRAPLFGAGLLRERPRPAAARTALPRPLRSEMPEAVVSAPAGPGSAPAVSGSAAPSLSLDLELMRGLHAVRYLEAGLLRVEAAGLAWMREKKAHREIGFASFGDLTRWMQIAPRTAQERVRLHRLLLDRPNAEDAFRLGDLSLHQVLALAPLLREGDLERGGIVDWAARARQVSVGELRREVRKHLAARAAASEGVAEVEAG